MRFKVGDKVKVKTDLHGGCFYGSENDSERLSFEKMMERYCGVITEVIRVNPVKGTYVLACNTACRWSVGMLEPVGEEPSTTTTNNTVTVDLDTLTVQDKRIVLDFVEKSKNPFDIPTEEHTYYYINTVGRVVAELWQNTDGDNARYFLGNYFITRKDAEFELEKRKIARKLEILSKKVGGVDWRDSNTSKYYMEYNSFRGYVYIDSVNVYRQQGVVFFPTEESLQEAINLIGERNIKKYIFGVEE